MRILITGSNGMLGSDLVAALSPTYEVSGIGLRPSRHPKIEYLQVDITSSALVSKAISQLKPAIIIHAAAYTDVDGCERNPHQAFLVNVKGTEFVAEAANQVEATLFFISSDYVFDGTKKSSYSETDSPNPLSVYGKSKFEAENFLRAHSHSTWIIRSSWLYGENGRNFFKAILERVKAGESLKVVDDQSGAPTYTKDLAASLKILVEKGKRPKQSVIYHIANSGATTWFGAAKKLVEKTGKNISVYPISSEELKRPAPRPGNSIFNLNQIKMDYGIELRDWSAAFEDYWSESLSKQYQEMNAGQP